MSSGLLTPVALFTSSAGALTWTVNAWQGMGLHLPQNKALQSTTVQAIPLRSCAQGACLRQLSRRRVMQPAGQQVLCTDPLAVPLIVGGTYIDKCRDGMAFSCRGRGCGRPSRPGAAARQGCRAGTGSAARSSSIACAGSGPRCCCALRWAARG